MERRGFWARHGAASAASLLERAGASALAEIAPRSAYLPR